MNFDSVTHIQIETSSICNAACPQCLRESKNGDYSFFKQTYIPTNFYSNRIPDQVYNNLKSIEFCGVMGDPCTAPNFIDICRIIKSKNPNIQITISTNGGMRSPDWWAELASVLTSKDYVKFCIDGLEDTNWIYRVNVRWTKLIENAKAFISAGGYAHWQFIPFKHNEHQITDAEVFSKELGFKNFFIVHNNRFLTDALLGVPPAKGANGLLLEPPTSEEEQHVFLDKKDLDMFNDHVIWMQQAEKSNIACQAINKKELYIDAETHLFPCCMTAAAKFTLDPSEKNDGYFNLWNAHGGDNIKLSLNSWDNILGGKFFNQIQDSWHKKFGEGRLIVCSGVCSESEVIFTSFDNRKN